MDEVKALLTSGALLCLLSHICSHPESARASVDGHHRHARGRRKHRATPRCPEHWPRCPLQLCLIHSVEPPPIEPGIVIYLTTAASHHAKIRHHQRAPDLHDPFVDARRPRAPSGQVPGEARGPFPASLRPGHRLRRPWRRCRALLVPLPVPAPPR